MERMERMGENPMWSARFLKQYVGRACSAVLIFCVIWPLVPACGRKQETPVLPKTSIVPVSVKNELVIAAVGDVMMPASIQTAATRKKRGYDFLFENIAQDLRAADITFANLETPVDHKAVFSGYPRFNSRPALLTALRKAGVRVVSVANNHIMDAGTEGLKRTLGNIEAAGLVFIGAGRSKAEAAEIKYLKARDVNVAFLAYTYSSNRRLPRKAPQAPGVNILRTDSEADLASAAVTVRRARASADLVVVSLHWGDEYAVDPTPWQRRVASELVEAGADVILGHHPHVLQPIESHAASDGRVGLIAFSLGNFVSSQSAGITYRNKDHRKALRGDGIILSILVRKEGGKAAVERAEFLPTWSFRTKTGTGPMYRPIILSREIAVLTAKETRNATENGNMQLLNYRQECIIRKLAGKLE
jgi:poly-gamma-glutamate capsule biosynthesis protein CapA/YwtB (metallophosphatase superfamily)